jgi:quercetin dioxygenase-like cupin family protein
MTIKLVALVVLCLMTGTAAAQEPKVTSLMSKDLAENPGREALMITVEHAPGGSSAIHRHNAHAFVYVLEGSVVMQLKGGRQVTLTPGQSFAGFGSSTASRSIISRPRRTGLCSGSMQV